jgi:hypothetical protein
MPHDQPPYVIVYQNPDFVGSLYQGFTNDGLPNSTQFETADGSEQARTGKDTAKGNFDAKLSVPGVGSVGGGLGAGQETSGREAWTASRRQRVEVSRDSALYLHQLHAGLAGVTRTVHANEGAADLEVGSFVKFQGKFRPDPIGALLDLCSPDAVAAVTRFAVRNAKRPQVMEDGWSIDDLKARWELAEQEATTRADLARTIAGAVHTDFRRGSTVELHCKIGDSLTALVVCETEHFVTADPDRPLDGEFTVFGKVISRPERDVPVFKKNKFLSRMDNDWVKSIFAQVTSKMKESFNDDMSLSAFLPIAEDGGTRPPFDLDFPAVIEGLSFSVLPIAIYV